VSWSKLGEDSGWIEPSLEHSWENAGGYLTVAYRKQGNEVRLRGSVNGGGEGTAVFTLPEGFRPTGSMFGRGHAGQSDQVIVTAAGAVQMWSTGGAAQSLDGITFTID
jgi:hypothetical protein